MNNKSSDNVCGTTNSQNAWLGPVMRTLHQPKVWFSSIGVKEDDSHYQASYVIIEREEGWRHQISLSLIRTLWNDENQCRWECVLQSTLIMKGEGRQLPLQISCIGLERWKGCRQSEVKASYIQLGRYCKHIILGAFCQNLLIVYKTVSNFF